MIVVGVIGIIFGCFMLYLSLQNYIAKKLGKGEFVGYWGLRLLGMSNIRASVGSYYLYNYDLRWLGVGEWNANRREWFYNLILSSSYNTRKKFCINNSFVGCDLFIKEFFEMKLVKSYILDFIAWVSLNHRVWGSKYMMDDSNDYVKDFMWNSGDIYKTISIDNLIKYSEIGYVNVPVASKSFTFKNIGEFLRFKPYLLKAGVILSSLVGINGIMSEWVSDEVVSFQLPSNAEKITDEIYKVGDDLWILKGGVFVRDHA